MLFFYLIIVYGLAYIADTIYFSRYATGSVTIKYNIVGRVSIYRSGIFRDHLLYRLDRKKYGPYEVLQVCKILDEYPVVPKGTMIKKLT